MTNWISFLVSQRWDYAAFSPCSLMRVTITCTGTSYFAARRPSPCNISLEHEGTNRGVTIGVTRGFFRARSTWMNLRWLSEQLWMYWATPFSIFEPLLSLFTVRVRCKHVHAHFSNICTLAELIFRESTNVPVKIAHQLYLLTLYWRRSAGMQSS